MLLLYSVIVCWWVMYVFWAFTAQGQLGSCDTVTKVLHVLTGGGTG